MSAETYDSVAERLLRFRAGSASIPATCTSASSTLPDSMTVHSSVRESSMLKPPPARVSLPACAPLPGRFFVLTAPW